jgi:hypothetical protein
VPKKIVLMNDRTQTVIDVYSIQEASLTREIFREWCPFLNAPAELGPATAPGADNERGMENSGQRIQQSSGGQSSARERCLLDDADWRHEL